MNQILYNCHTDGDQYRITKFNDGEVESSYLCTIDECECPAGYRPSCRHRHMLPRFIAKGAVNSFYFYDYDRQGWVTNEPSGKFEEWKPTIRQEPANEPIPMTINEIKALATEEPASSNQLSILPKPAQASGFEKHEQEIDAIAALADPTKLRRRL